MRPLNPRQAAFVAEYLRNGGVASDAAFKAGYSPTNSNRAGWQIMQKPQVKEAIAAKRNEVVEKGKYDLEAAIAELNTKINLAEKANQHSAVAKMMELKMKAHGLLVEKHEVRTSGFQITISKHVQHPEIEVKQLRPPILTYEQERQKQRFKQLEEEISDGAITSA